jgi:hypothetical protein
MKRKFQFSIILFIVFYHSISFALKNISGNYSTTVGDVLINQFGDKIVGVYSNGNSSLDGVIHNNTAKGVFHYSHSKEETGIFHFTFSLSSNAVIFTGYYKDHKTGKRGNWNGVTK